MESFKNTKNLNIKTLKEKKVDLKQTMLSL